MSAVFFVLFFVAVAIVAALFVAMFVADRTWYGVLGLFVLVGPAVLLAFGYLATTG